MLRVALAVALIRLVASPATQSAAVHRVQFVFSQGLPTEESLGGVVSTTNGTGAVTVARPLRPGLSGYSEVKAHVAKGDRFVHVDRVGGRTMRLVLAPIGASAAAFSDGSEADVIRLRLCPPVNEQHYQDGVRGRVWVQID